MSDKKSDKKYDLLWRNATNLVAAYDELRQIRELFANAKDAEKYVAEVEVIRDEVESNISALRETEKELHERCRVKAEEVNEQKKDAEEKLIAMKDSYIQRYEKNFGEKVKVAERLIEEKESTLAGLEKDRDKKEAKIGDLDTQLKQKESQMDALENQFKKIQESLAHIGGR